MRINASIDVMLNKDNGAKIAAESFFNNPQATEVVVVGYQAVAIYTYGGQRSDELEIRDNVELLRAFKL